jgi:hypothetical protein
LNSRSFNFALAPLLVIVVPLLLATASRSAAAQEWTLTTADLRTQTGVLGGIDSGTVRLAAASGGAPAAVPLDQFLSAVRQPASPTPAADAFVLMLTDGQRLTGQPKTMLEDKLAWTSDTLGEVDLPMARLRGILHRAPASPAFATLAGPPPRQDMIILRNGDTVSGVFTAATASTLTLQSDTGAVDVPLSAVSRVDFAAAGAAAPASRHNAPPGRTFLIGLSDGSSLLATNLTLDDTKANFTFASSARTVPMEEVASIEQLDGPVSWLSSRQPVEEMAIPYFGSPAVVWPARFDAAVDGGPLLAGGKTFERGIGVHAYSRLTFDIESGWMAFRTQYAADRGRQGDFRLADLTVRVLLNGAIVYERQHVRDGGISPVVTVPLKSPGRLTLECDFGGSGNTQARLDWIEPALLRAMPASQATTQR